MKKGIKLIIEERQEQINKHNRTIERDVIENEFAQLAFAAQKLVTPIIKGNPLYSECETPPINWNKEIWEKLINKSRKERLIIAGALIAAEIDRLNYLEGKDKVKLVSIKGNEIKQITREEAQFTPHFQSESGEFFTIDL